MKNEPLSITLDSLAQFLRSPEFQWLQMQARNSARECRLALEDLDPMADAVNMARAQGALSAYRDLASDDFPDQLMTALAESLPKEN